MKKPGYGHKILTSKNWKKYVGHMIKIEWSVGEVTKGIFLGKNPNHMGYMFFYFDEELRDIDGFDYLDQVIEISKFKKL